MIDCQQRTGHLASLGAREVSRTEFERPGIGTVQFEAIYLDWSDHGGVRYPDLIIEKENNELARILVVDTVTAGSSWQLIELEDEAL